MQLVHVTLNAYVLIVLPPTAEFEDWKCDLEEQEMCSYVKCTGMKSTADNNQVCYYYCSRSGYFNSKGRGKRQIKSQGTSKLNTYCTAAIKTIKSPFPHSKLTPPANVPSSHVAVASNPANAPRRT